MPTPPLRYLAAADVVAAMPPIDERLDLAERTMVALVHDAELPAKIGVHPRQDGSFAHAMPAYLHGSGTAADLLGIKWVSGFPENSAIGLPAISAVVVMSDPGTGLPVAILDGGPITAQRTAAVSGVAIAQFGRAGATRAALIGAGIQGHSHLPVIGHQLPGIRLAIHDRQPDRADALAEAARSTPGIASVEVAATARDAVAGADVVVTAASFAPPNERQSMTNDWLAPDTLVVAIDYATMVNAEVARDAVLFLTDDRGQFLANRDAGQFDGYPDPTATIGEAILDGRPVPAHGRILVSHLGVGLADVVFADAILRRTEDLGIGMDLPPMTSDLVVVGAGTMGAWTARRGQQAGLDVTLIDAYGAGNSRATSGDETRITRSSYGPDELYATWAVEARDAWIELGRETGETIYVPCGTIWFAHHEDGFEAASAATLTGLGIPVERLTPGEVAERWPQITSSDLLFATFEPDGGLLMARRGVAAVARRFVAEGGRFELGWAKPGRSDGRRLLDVETGDGRHEAGTFVYAGGPWLPRLFPELLGDLIKVTKQDVVYVGPSAGDGRFDASQMPCFVDYDAAFYGIPQVDGRGFKVAPDRYGPVFDPSSGERLVDPESVRLARRYLAERFPGLADAPVIETRICQYETTPDTHFIIDRHPDYDNVWIAGGGSGHAFKHGPVIGRYVIERINGAAAGPEGDRFGLGHVREPKPNMRTGADGMVEGWSGW